MVLQSPISADELVTRLRSLTANLLGLLVTDTGPEELHDLRLPRLVLGLIGLQQDVRQLPAGPERLTNLAELTLGLA